MGHVSVPRAAVDNTARVICHPTTASPATPKPPTQKQYVHINKMNQYCT